MTSPATRRARGSLWVLLTLAVLLTGALGKVARAEPSPRIGLAVAVLGLLLLVTMALATRVLLALTRRPERPSRDGRSGS